jgi:GDP-4-dehydro-6-deoxy-D-mannose reductase
MTGGNGFVGRKLVASLQALPEPKDIIVAAYGSEKISHDRARVIEMDVTDAERVKAVIAGEKPTHVFHLAAVSAISAAQHDVRKTWAVNFQGTLNVALSVIEMVPDCRLLYCSSAFIYGDSFRAGKPLDESALLEPSNPYGASKAAADLMIGQMAKQGLHAIRLRPFNHTGAGQSGDFVVPSFAAQIVRIERGEEDPIIYVGDLSARRDFLDVRDVIDAYMRAILRFDQLPRGCALNIASGHAISTREVLDFLLAQSSKKIEVRLDRQRMRGNDMPIIVGDASLARRLLNWTPRIDLASTLTSVLDFLRGTKEQAHD